MLGKILTVIACTPLVSVTIAAADVPVTYAVRYVQDATGVTGTITGTAPYTTPADPLPAGTFSTGTYTDVGPGFFGAGGTLTTTIDAVGFDGAWDTLPIDLVNPPGSAFIDPTSVSGPLVYFYGEIFNGQEFGNYYQADGLTAGTAVDATIFFAGQTLADLGIVETAPVLLTFTPDNAADFTPFAVTFEAVIPEPAGLAVFGLGSTTLLRRRR